MQGLKCARALARAGGRVDALAARVERATPRNGRVEHLLVVAARHLPVPRTARRSQWCAVHGVHRALHRELCTVVWAALPRADRPSAHPASSDISVAAARYFESDLRHFGYNNSLRTAVAVEDEPETPPAAHHAAFAQPAPQPLQQQMEAWLSAQQSATQGTRRRDEEARAPSADGSAQQAADMSAFADWVAGLGLAMPQEDEEVQKLLPFYRKAVAAIKLQQQGVSRALA